MKKLLVLLFLIFTLLSCDQLVARHYGGSHTISIKKGYKVTNATFKDNDIWYFIEPMEPDYVPRTKYLKESTPIGALEGEIIFKESR